MRATEITTGRQFAVAFDHGEDFFPALESFCAEHGITAGYIPMFVGGFRTARLVGSCKPLENPEAPLWEETEVEFVEAFGAGTLAWASPATPTPSPSPPNHPTSSGPAGRPLRPGRRASLCGGESRVIDRIVCRRCGVGTADNG